MSYRCFTRAWWREAAKADGKWPNNLVPNAGGRKTTIGKAYTEEEARAICRRYNETHKPGRYSRKAEYEKI